MIKDPYRAEKWGDMGSVPQTFTQPPTNKRGKYLCVTGPKQLPVCDYVAKNKA